jgi:hypothetical protein
MRVKVFLFACVLSVSVIPSAFAMDRLPEFEAIRTQQAEIRAGVAARTGRYQDMPESTRDQLLTKQAQVLNTIDQKSSGAELTEEQRLEVFNALEWIEAAINKDDDDRMVCERRKTLGSNRKERVCKTVAQMREERERAREELDRSDMQMIR